MLAKMDYETAAIELAGFAAKLNSTTVANATWLDL